MERFKQHIGELLVLVLATGIGGLILFSALSLLPGASYASGFYSGGVTLSFWLVAGSLVGVAAFIRWGLR